jgi:hypothetical protein
VASLWDNFTNPGEIFQELWQRTTVWPLLSARAFSTILSTYSLAEQTRGFIEAAKAENTESTKIRWLGT